MTLIIRQLFFIGFLIPVLSPANDPADTPYLDEFVSMKYQQLDENELELPPYDLFDLGITGHLNLKHEKAVAKELLTLVDFRISSNKKRLWVIDLNQDRVLFHAVVSHGKNTGDEYAKHFSNTPESNKSSLGFYSTGEKYYGKHGLSLRLDGMETGFNDNARERAIVMHGANYATLDFASTYGRLGRSFGCPAIPKKVHKELINLISEKSTLFIYYPSQDYLQTSKLLDRPKAELLLSGIVSSTN